MIRSILCIVAGSCGMLAVTSGFAERPGAAVAYAFIACACWAAKNEFDYPKERK